MTTKKEATDQTEGGEDAFTSDLALAQAEMEDAARDSVNPHFRSSYASLKAVRAATLPALNKYGFTIVQTIEPVTMNFADTITTALFVVTELGHRSGKNRTSKYPVRGGTPQQEGSAITYARRYSWSAICGIAADDDDDGNAAEGAGIKTESKKDSRPLFEGLINEMQKCQTRNELFSWRHSIAPRRARLPKDWQEQFDEQVEIFRVNMIDMERSLAEPEAEDESQPDNEA